MKNILNGFIALVLGSMILYAQLNIGGNPSESKGSLVSFGPLAKAVVMPRVINAASATIAGIQAGTIIYDYEAGCMKVRLASSWTACPPEPGMKATLTGTDIATSKAIIGADTSPADGALILERDTMAIILPNVNNPTLDFGSGQPGMMVYDTIRNCLSVSDGFRWRCYKE